MVENFLLLLEGPTRSVLSILHRTVFGKFFLRRREGVYMLTETYKISVETSRKVLNFPVFPSG